MNDMIIDEPMARETEYVNSTDTEHIKSYGQYFTRREAAAFMCRWACENAHNMLDPAVGNSIFFEETKKIYPQCRLSGYEIDPYILSCFGNPAGEEIKIKDYLLNDWDLKYDAIVCNPPYNRFQSVSNRDEVLKSIHEHTGIRYSAYTNHYILFLIKSISQLSETGRLAYIIPTEFLNSKYGTPVKEKLLKDRLLKAIINFKNDDEMFEGATTTCCILLLDHENKQNALFYNLSSVSELKDLRVGEVSGKTISVPYDKLKPNEKWRSYLFHETILSYVNLVDVSKFCQISRGIATGANYFFCMSKSKMKAYGIPDDAVMRCICRSADVKTPIFKEENFRELADMDRNVYVLDVRENSDGQYSRISSKSIAGYLSKGISEGIDRKYLPSRRHPWYSMEHKPIAPIWVSSAYRNGMKFIRNLASVNTLTTFHLVYINRVYEDLTDLIFCYFLTPIAQEIIRENRKELGNGLEKFQPSDLNHARMLDISLINDEDREQILEIYDKMLYGFTTDQINQLNNIFSNYLIHK